MFVLTLWPIAAAPRAEATARTIAADKDYSLWQPHYSPNGRWISFIALKTNEFGHTNILEVIPANATGATERQWIAITDKHSWVDKPRWAPDGRKLFFVKQSDSFWNLWAIRIDPDRGLPVGSPIQITRFNTAGLQLSPVFIMADVGISARRLILAMMERSGNIWTVDNADR